MLFAQLWATDGVVRGGDSELLVQPHAPNNLSVDVLAGQIWAQGDFGRMGTTTVFPLTGGAAPDGVNPRIDTVVARLNYSTHKIEMLYRTGVAAGSPVAPTLVRTPGVTWDIALANVAVAAGASSIVAGNITDRRPYSSGGSAVRGISTPSAASLTIQNIDQVPQGGIVIVPVTGTTNITAINGPAAGNPIIILEFASTLNVVNGGNLSIGRDLATVVGGGTIQVLQWTGSVWREIARANERCGANTFLGGPSSGGSGPLQSRSLVQDDFPASLWSTANPVGVLQNSGIAFTVQQARLLKMGKFFHYQMAITLTPATGSAGFVISLTLPFTYSGGSSDIPMGVFNYHRTAGLNLVGVVCSLNGSTTIDFRVADVPDATLLGVFPSFAQAAGDQLWLNISGELA